MTANMIHPGYSGLRYKKAHMVEDMYCSFSFLIPRLDQYQLANHQTRTWSTTSTTMAQSMATSTIIGPNVMAMRGAKLYDEFYDNNISVPLTAYYMLPAQTWNEYQCFDVRVQPETDSFTLWLAVKHIPNSQPSMAIGTRLTITLWKGGASNPIPLGESIHGVQVYKCGVVPARRPQTFAGILKFRFSKEEAYKELWNVLTSPNFAQTDFSVTVQASTSWRISLLGCTYISLSWQTAWFSNSLEITVTWNHREEWIFIFIANLYTQIIHSFLYYFLLLLCTKYTRLYTWVTIV